MFSLTRGVSNDIDSNEELKYVHKLDIDSVVKRIRQGIGLSTNNGLYTSHVFKRQKNGRCLRY